jgi:hypothetical protein
MVLLTFLPFFFQSRSEEVGSLAEQCLVHFILSPLLSYDECSDGSLVAGFVLVLGGIKQQ